MENKWIELFQTVNRRVDFLTKLKKPRHDKSIDAHSRFEYAVKEKIIFASIGDLAEYIAPDRQSRHKSRKNRGDGVGRVAEDLRQHASPHHLVNQTSDT